jgi:tRNA (guanine37-N1)-methyltransferase
MGDRVLRIRRDGAFIPSDRGIEPALLQQQISKVRQRRRIVRQRLECRREVLAGGLAPVQTDARYAAFVEEEGALRRSERIAREQIGELRLGRGEIATAQRFQRASKSALIPKHASSMFTIDVVTLFPELFAPFVGLSIVGRAVEGGVATVRYHHLLDELADAERADDAPFGGGAGMVLRIEPIARVLDRIARDAGEESTAIVAPSASGARFTHRDAARWAKLHRLVIVCGHYEGIDDRLAALYPIEERSLGDFVLTGGEIPALAFMDATIRLLAGTLRPESLESESFTGGVLDYPSFTRPAVFRGVAVPPVLLSGDHAKIAQWRREQSRLRTAARRRDLLEGVNHLTKVSQPDILDE